VTLDQWLRQKGMSEEAFAVLVDGTCTQSLVSKWRRGVVLPSEARLYRIGAITLGAVSSRGLVLRYKRVKAARIARGEAFRKERGIE
jgi:hypothetical protein